MRLKPNRASILKVRQSEKGRSMMPVRMTTDTMTRAPLHRRRAQAVLPQQIDYADDATDREGERNKRVHNDGLATKTHGRDGVVGGFLVVSEGDAVGKRDWHLVPVALDSGRAVGK